MLPVQPGQRLAAANLYDELTAAGGESQALDPAPALANLRGLAGTMLDPSVLAALEQVVPDRA